MAQPVQSGGYDSQKKLVKKKILMRGVSFVTLAFAVVTLLATVFVVSKNVDELSVEVEKNKADVILASANVADQTSVKVPILYYDQRMDECVNLYDMSMQAAVNARQFEWQSCGYYNEEIETGLVEPKLDSMFLPVAVGGEKVPNRGMKNDGFSRWFNAVDGLSYSYAGTIGLVYDSESASFNYRSENFYPLNEISVPNEVVNADGNNHLFTLGLGVPFQVLASGDEEFTITADDDTWVFVGDSLVIDMGGVHNATTGRMKITDEGEVYTGVEDESLAYAGVRLKAREGAIVRIFHADRDAEDSVFKVTFSNMVLNIMDSALAKTDEEGVEVAYDPANPSYVPPLGESLRTEPDKTRALAATIAVQLMAIGVIIVIILMIISVAWRYSHLDCNQEQ